MTDKIPSGLIVVACGDSARYTNFSAAISRSVLFLDEDSALMWSIGATVADNLNDGMRALMQSPKLDWVLTIGDDHEWDGEMIPLLLQRMYQRDLDVLVPLTPRRSWPPGFVIYNQMDEDGVVWPIMPDEIAEILRSGDYTREVYAAGNACMVIRRRVIEALEDPWWQNGLEGPGGRIISQAGEDINFCEKVRRTTNPETGEPFKIHAAFDLPLGHITSVTLAPEMVNDVFGVRMFFGGRQGPFIKCTEASSGEQSRAG